MKYSNKLLLLFSATLVLGFSACKKSYLDRLPSDEAPLSDVFKTTVGAEAALQGLHAMMYEARDEEQFGQGSISLDNDLMGEDMVLSDYGAGWFIPTYQYQDSRSGGGTASYTWDFYFRLINNANEILAHIDAAEGPQSDKDDIKGQSLFYRAYAYYQLSLLFQHTFKAVTTDAPGLPIYTEPTQVGNRRASIGEVYNQIDADLTSSANLLEPFGGQRIDKSDINIDVVNGLRARVALVQEHWQAAADYAHAARANYPIMLMNQVDNGFNEWGNSEWIWGSHLVEEQTNNTHSFIGQMDVDAGVYAALGQQKLINSQLYNHIANTDARKAWWYKNPSGTNRRYNQRKFRVKVPGTFSNDMVYMRSSEMALIEAEAYANLNQLSNAQAPLQELMDNRDTAFVMPATINDLLREVWYQRRIELWGEGFRFPDIKRSVTFDYLTGNEKGLHREGTGADEAVVGGTMTITDPLDNKFLYRIPSSEISRNPNMSGADQNP